jgi:hypothetical protein|tara:strand:- start:2019 stop:2315 length:297 start_codon:yes stop_codon:yes gene_type:complete
MKSEYPKLKPLELLHRAWEDRGKRIHIHENTEQIQELLLYKEAEVPANPFNHMRDEIMLYIKEHKNMLSLPCDGNCYGHTDGVVVFCHQQLMEDQNGR